MIDREKVIRAVKTCFDSWIDKHRNMGLDLHEVERMKRDALELLREQEPIVGWISVKDRMPEQHNSMFAPWFNSHKWANAMWYEESDRVIVAMRFPDGTRAVSTAKLYDGKWKTDVGRSLNPVVTHWQPFPELPKENE